MYSKKKLSSSAGLKQRGGSAGCPTSKIQNFSVLLEKLAFGKFLSPLSIKNNTSIHFIVVSLHINGIPSIFRIGKFYFNDYNYI